MEKKKYTKQKLLQVDRDLRNKCYDIRTLDLSAFKEELYDAIEHGYKINERIDPTEPLTLINRAIYACGDSSFSPEQEEKFVELIKLLIDAGADVNSKTNRGASVLIWAATIVSFPIEAFRLIVDHSNKTYLDYVWRHAGATITALGEMCLTYVCSESKRLESKQRSLEKIMMLLEAGANPDIDTSWLITGKRSEDPKRYDLQQELLKIIANYKEQQIQMRDTATVYYDYEL